MRRELTTHGGGPVWDFMSEVERAFDDFWGVPQTSTALESFIPAVDVQETDDYYLLMIDVPGMNQKDIKIEFHGGRLTVSGERNREQKSDEKNFKRFERSTGSFQRSFQLPKDIDEGKIQARSENGVLEIMIPKAEVAKPRSIQIEAEKGGLFSRLLGQKETAKPINQQQEERH